MARSAHLLSYWALLSLCSVAQGAITNVNTSSGATGVPLGCSTPASWDWAVTTHGAGMMAIGAAEGDTRTPAARVLHTVSHAEAFGISRLELQLDDGSSLQVVTKGALLRPRAVVSFFGAGLLIATWELADPSTTAGEPVFGPLQTVQQVLAGSEPVTLIGPILPTIIPGSYIVRLTIRDPAMAFEYPEARYYVSAGVK